MASKTHGYSKLKFLLSLLVGSYLTSTANNDGQQLQQHETRMMVRDDKEHNNDDESPPTSNAGGFFSFCYYLAVLTAPKKIYTFILDFLNLLA